MKIEKIEIQNYRAFYGKHEIKVESKNLLVYGENGSGKSSFFQAISDFFCSTDLINNINFEENKWNSIIPNGEPPKIVLTFTDNSTIEFNPSIATPKTPDFLHEIGKQKPFFTYRRLLKTYLVDKGEVEKRLFRLLVEDILSSYIDPNKVSIHKYWTDYKKLIKKQGRLNSTDRQIQKSLINFTKSLRDCVKEGIEITNTEKKPSLTFITNEYLNKFFDLNIELEIDTPNFENNETVAWKARNIAWQQVENAKLSINVKLYNEEIPEFNFFLNEARLSALAICLYFASLKCIPVPNNMKILFLDDIFIGLDTSNRKPLLEILKQEFFDWQIFITTYDRHWFELAKHSLPSWGKAEMYVGKIENTEYEIPIFISNSETAYEKAVKYFNKEGKSKDYIDYPAAGNYLRKTCENLLKGILFGKYRYNENGKTGELNLKEDITELFVSFEKMMKDLTLDFSPFANYAGELKSTLHPLSHDNLDKPIYKTEIEAAFILIEDLKKVKQKIILEKEEVISFEKAKTDGTIRKTFLKIVIYDFALIDQNGNKKVFKCTLKPINYSESNGNSKPLDFMPECSLEKAYDLIYHDMFRVPNASQTLADIYSEFKSESQNLTLRQIIDSL